MFKARYTQIGDQLQELAASRAEEAARAKRAGARKLAVAKERVEVRVSKIGEIIIISKILQIFGGLVLGCIKTKFCKRICVRQLFSSSTRFASFCTAAISKFSQKNCLKKQQFS